MDHHELLHRYSEGDQYHSDLFSEQRSNLQLVAGNHYTKKTQQWWNRVRTNENLSRYQKLRLTKNHIQRVTKILRNQFLTYAPGTTIKPRNMEEVQDQKSAELYNSAWHDIKLRHKMPRFFSWLVKDFTEIGELCCKIGYDYGKGKFLGYEYEEDDEGRPRLGDDGDIIPISRFTGDHVFERILGFNLITDPGATSFEEAEYVIVKKMINTKSLQRRYAKQPEKLRWITESSDSSFKVFDSNKGSFAGAQGMSLIQEHYYRPSEVHPEGMFYFVTEAGILEEGELPLGVFPLVYAGFDELTTSSRSQSIIRQLRSYQAEINRSASKIAEHQITLGDDKLVVTGGGMISPGGTAHGVKAIKATGGDLKHLAGRSGEQYVAYMLGQIEEMYKVANLKEELEEKSQQLDPYTALYATIKDKKRFQLYTDKIVDAFKEITMLSLRFAKEYWDEEMIVPVIGKREFMNIPEFKAADDLGHQIEVEEQNDNVEGRLGRLLGLNHMIQYVGSNMDKADLGALIRAHPYMNQEEALVDLTLDYDNVKNDILALDRGEPVPADPDDNHDYVIKHLTRRMKQKDFKLLPPQVQQMYQQKRAEHREIRQQQIVAAQRAQAGFIPAQGYLVTCDFYVPDPVDPSKQPRKARVPYDALEWLLKKLGEQGQTIQQMEGMEAQVLAEMVQNGLGAQQGLPPGQEQGPMQGQVYNMA